MGLKVSYEIAKIHWQNLKIFSRTTGPISTKLGTMHPWVKGTQVHSNEGLCPFPRGDNYEIAKIHWQNLKIFSRTTGPISTKPDTVHPWVKGIQVCSNEEPFNSHKVNNELFLLIIIVIIMCFLIFKKISRWALWPMGLLFIFHYLSDDLTQSTFSFFDNNTIKKLLQMCANSKENSEKFERKRNW